jgi:hypothetical protein
MYGEPHRSEVSGKKRFLLAIFDDLGAHAVGWTACSEFC